MQVYSLGFAALSLLLGAALAVYDLRPSTRLPDDVVAMVNHQPITQRYFQKAVDIFATQRQRSATEEEQQHILDRMIEEELLVQAAINLDYPSADNQVRTLLVRAMRNRVFDDQAQLNPDESTLKAFYQKYQHRFKPALLHVRQVRLTDPDHAQQAQQLYATPMRFDTVWQQQRAAVIDVLPDQLLPAAKIYQLLGETLTQLLVDLTVGEMAMMTRDNVSVVIKMVERQTPSAPEFESLDTEQRDHLLSAYQQDANRTRFVQYTDQLRQQADIIIRPW